MPATRFIALAAALLLAACDKPDASKDAPPKPLLIGQEDLLTVTRSMLASGPVVTGTIQSARRADLRAEVSAVVLQVMRENGDAVKRGDLLVRLDDTAIRDSLASAEESVRAARQSYEQADRQLARLQKLRQSGMASTQQLDDAETRRNNAQSDLAAARTRQAQARQQLGRTEVRAPFDGIVSNRKVSSGDTSQLGKELLMVIDPASLRFEGFVSADVVTQVKPGQTVSFRINGYGAQEFLGRVERVSPAANPTTRQVEVQIGFSGTNRPAVSGLYAEGRITSDTPAITLPAGALAREGDKVFAWRIDGAALRKTPIEIGERDPRRGDYVVLSGLDEGARILRSPALTLTDGRAIELMPAGQASPAAAAPDAKGG